MIKPIELKNSKEVRAVNDFATSRDYDVYIHGTSIMLDAKSLMGLLSLVGTKNLNIVVPDNVNPIRFARELSKCGIA